MPLQLNDRINPPTTAQLLTDLRATAQKLGQNTITRQQYRQHGNHYPTRYIRTFGSWNNAVLQAGLQIKKRYNIPVADLFTNLRQLWHTLGRQPTTTDLYPPGSRFGMRPYLRIFRTWTNALTQFVASENKTTTQQPNHPIPPTTQPPQKQPTPKTITHRLRYQVLRRDNFRCRICGASPALSAPVIARNEATAPRTPHPSLRGTKQPPLAPAIARNEATPHPLPSPLAPHPRTPNPSHPAPALNHASHRSHHPHQQRRP